MRSGAPRDKIWARSNGLGSVGGSEIDGMYAFWEKGKANEFGCAPFSILNGFLRFRKGSESPKMSDFMP